MCTGTKGVDVNVPRWDVRTSRPYNLVNKDDVVRFMALLSRRVMRLHWLSIAGGFCRANSGSQYDLHVL
jgi:hypothetical protein